jgi:hypothetical protein
MQGSFFNRVMEQSASPTPELGMGATELCYSDRRAYTVVLLIDAKTIVAQADHAVRTDNNGMSDSQSYRYEPNPEGRTVTLTLRKNGNWIEKGQPMKNGTVFALGYRNAYYDYSF